MTIFLTKVNRFAFLLARAIVADYARQQNKLNVIIGAHQFYTVVVVWGLMASDKQDVRGKQAGITDWNYTMFL